MKVLWLCNIALPVIARELNMEVSNKEGWLSGLAGTLLERRRENGIELSVAFPMQGNEFPEGQVIASMSCYGFPEDIGHPEKYDENLELVLKKIVDKVKPDIVHCFGTEYPHTLAMCRIFPEKDRLLVGVQGLCTPIAEAYFADLPERVRNSVTLRDWLRKDSLKQQQEKFVLRGKHEREIIRLTGNVAGRTGWDRISAAQWNPQARYFLLNETLRPDFYGPVWREEECIPHSIFLSQGDYPLKGLHYMLLALPAILDRYPDAKVYVAGADLTACGTLKQKLKISAYGKYLRKLAESRERKGKILFLGRMNAGQMRDRYLKSSLYVCPSALENSPNSLGEAMLLGMPCVCAAVGGIPSMFTGGVDGILYEGFAMPGVAGTGREAQAEAAVGQAAQEGAGAGQNAQEEAAAGREAREEAEAGQKAWEEAGAGQKVREEETAERQGQAAGEKRKDPEETEQDKAGNSPLELVAGRLARAVIEMWDNPDRQRIYCHNARAHAMETHNREKNYAKLIEIYTDLMKASGTGSGRRK